MKKVSLMAIVVMVAAIAIAVVSCKKDNQNASLNDQSLSSQKFDPTQIADMNAYLKGFKQKTKESQFSKDAEMLSLEEAAWHLSSLANYDFANANVEFTDLHYDTLHYQVNVINGQVSLSDLNTVYESMASDIDNYYQSLDLQEKHFRFIGVSVSEYGQVEVGLIVSYTILDHTWYFEDDFIASVYCYDFFDQDTYIWNTTAITQLEYAINLLEGRDFILPGETPSGRVYYVYTMDTTYQHWNCIDPYGSPFYGNSRIYVEEDDPYATPVLTANDMCYCLDSYLGLPTYNNASIIGRPVCWHINPYYYNNAKWYIFCHSVTVTFGIAVSNGTPIRY